MRNCVNVAFANYPWNNGANDVSSGSGVVSCGNVEASFYRTPPPDTSGYSGLIVYADLDSEVVSGQQSSILTTPLWQGCG